jgi:hypothetical protein
LPCAFQTKQSYSLRLFIKQSTLFPHPHQTIKAETESTKTSMVQLRALSTIFLLLFLLCFTTSLTALVHSSASQVAVAAEGKHVMREFHGRTWQRKLLINHGSFRGPRKHLLNPTLHQPFEAQKLPV